MELSQKKFFELIHELIKLRMSPKQTLTFLTTPEYGLKNEQFESSFHFSTKQLKYDLFHINPGKGTDFVSWDTTYFEIREQISFIMEALLREIEKEMNFLKIEHLVSSFIESPKINYKSFKFKQENFRTGNIYIYKLDKIQMEIFNLDEYSSETVESISARKEKSLAILKPKQTDTCFLRQCAQNCIKIFDKDVKQQEVAHWIFSEYYMHTKYTQTTCWKQILEKIPLLGVVTKEKFQDYLKFTGFDMIMNHEIIIKSSELEFAIKIIEAVPEGISVRPDLALLNVCYKCIDVQNFFYQPKPWSLTLLAKKESSKNIIGKYKGYIILLLKNTYIFRKVAKKKITLQNETKFALDSQNISTYRYSLKSRRVRKGISSVSKYLGITHEKIAKYIFKNDHKRFQYTIGKEMLFADDLIQYFNNLNRLLLKCLLLFFVKDFSYFPEEKIFIYRSFHQLMDEEKQDLFSDQIYIKERYLIIKRQTVFLVKKFDENENIDYLEELIQQFDFPELELDNQCKFHLIRHINHHAEKLEESNLVQNQHVALNFFKSTHNVFNY